MIKLKRAYEKAEKEDGFRVLVDRLWPRGMSKAKEHLNAWMKDIAPSTELRKKFGHDPKKWNFFKKEYIHELQAKEDLIYEIKNLIQHHKVITLVYGAQDELHNNAVILKEFLTKK